VSDPESFLSRWSRLKQEANTVARAEPEPASVVAPVDAVKSAAAAAAAADVTAATAADVVVEPTRGEGVISPALPFDPASLPPVSSITQASDISQFLQAGVPADLVRAALRAAWVADPAIRDFIEITDNQWDFNDPTAMPGFGPLEAADSARAFAQRSVARVNEVAGAVERMPELATRSAVDAANLPREGQVDGVWLSAGMTEQRGSRVGSGSLPPQTRQSVTDPDLHADPDRHADPHPDPHPGPHPAGASGSSDLRRGPRVHGSALPKARK
jgi:hypothetical protein